MKFLKINSLILGLLALNMVACHSGWDQDPFSGKDGNVQNAVPQGGNKIKVPPVQDVMRIDVAPTFVLKEGKSRVIKIESRILHPEFKPLGLEIPNLENELPGATFDQATGELSIEVPEDFVPDGSIVYSTIVRVAMFAEYKGLKQQVQREIAIHVLRGNSGEPEVREVVGFNGKFREGRRYDFRIRVHDKASPSGPILAITNDSNSKKNGTQFIVYKKKGRHLGQGIYQFDATLDLRDEVTSSNESFSFYIQAFSAFGEPSQPFFQSYRVYTKATRPTYYGTSDRLKLTATENFHYEFTFAVPEGDGQLEAEMDADCASKLGGTVECGCGGKVSSFYNSVQCWVKGAPENPGTFSFYARSKNTANKGTNFESVSQESKRIWVNVAKAPEPEKCVEPDPVEPPPMEEPLPTSEEI